MLQLIMDIFHKRWAHFPHALVAYNNNRNFSWLNENNS